YSGASSAIRESTISDNGAQQAGGIGNYGQLYVVNSTISRNYANGDAGGVYNGLAAYFYNASIINNDADHDRDELGGIGGGLYVEPGSPTFVVNTLVLDNTIEDAPIYDDCHGTLIGYGANLFTDISGCTVDGARTIVPLGTMGALQDNGGPTLTHAPHADSLAIDNTNDALGCVDETGAPLSIDQRGAARIAGLRCDIGALEVGAAVERIFRSGFE
ncbi:MAG: choice-of-anchor Q domain-containing protein, partial [Dokdonella sp.]